jgi:hypothetical protein
LGEEEVAEGACPRAAERERHGVAPRKELAVLGIKAFILCEEVKGRV